ncbi:MAG: hypothetical protein AB1454_12520 [Candidatus Auribacterota bacterium]
MIALVEQMKEFKKTFGRSLQEKSEEEYCRMVYRNITTILKKVYVPGTLDWIRSRPELSVRYERLENEWQDAWELYKNGLCKKVILDDAAQQYCEFMKEMIELFKNSRMTIKNLVTI